MKINYEYTKEDYKKFLLKSRIKNNIILFIIGIAIYLYFCYDKISLLYLPLYIMGLIILIFILNKLYIVSTFKLNELMNYNLYGKYVLELTPNKFSITVNKNKTDYKYNRIKKIVEKKDNFVIKFNKSRDSLIFERRNFKAEDYIKIRETFNKNIKSHH